MQLSTLIADVERILTDEERAGNAAFEQSRRIIRKTKTAIHGIHTGNRDPELIDSISSDLAGLLESLSGYPRLICGGDVEAAMSEFSETVIYDCASRGVPLPSYLDLDVTPGAWLMGLADCIGELRRDMLAALSGGGTVRAEELFGIMEELSDALMVFDVKDSVVPIRRKQDIARGIMDRSRTDIATAKIMRR